MVLEIDTVYRTIKIKRTVNIGELFKVIMNMFPDFEYEKWVITEYPIPDYKWVPGQVGTGTGIGLWPQQQPIPYTSPNPGHIWVGDDPNKYKVTGGLGTITMEGLSTGSIIGDNGLKTS